MENSFNEAKAQKEQRLAALAEDTRRRLKRSALDIYYIGLNLLEARNITAHGEFLPWLRREFGMGKTSAYQFIHVAEAFHAKLPIIGNSIQMIAPTALYKLAAPSTPEAARSEAIERVLAGVAVGLDVAKEIIKKHKPPKITKTQLPTASPIAEQSAKNQMEAPALSEFKSSQPQPPTAAPTRAETPSAVFPQTFQSASGTAPSGMWYQLEGQHLLYCGNPNSEEFLTRIPGKVQLLLAFPPASIWQSRITAKARIILSDNLPIFHNPAQLDEVLKPLILSNSCRGDLVVTCFLPSPEIAFIIKRLDRFCLFAEPNYRRCNNIIEAFENEAS